MTAMVSELVLGANLQLEANNTHTYTHTHANILSGSCVFACHRLDGCYGDSSFFLDNEDGREKRHKKTFTKTTQQIKEEGKNQQKSGKPFYI